jgi:hypothetical protein
VFQPRTWAFWLLIFIGSILLGIGSYFLFFIHLQIPGMPWNFRFYAPALQQKIVENQYLPNRKVFEYPTVIHQIPTPAEPVNLMNPFVIPGLDNVFFNNNRFQKKHELLEYQGTIETDTSIFGLVRINTTGESLVVSEGEDLVVSGIIIGKITPKTLTYSQNGIEKVIYLGGTSN